MCFLLEIFINCFYVKVLIVGGNGVSYGVKFLGDCFWWDIFFDEVKLKLMLEQLSCLYFFGIIFYNYFINLL